MATTGKRLHVARPGSDFLLSFKSPIELSKFEVQYQAHFEQSLDISITPNCASQDHISFPLPSFPSPGALRACLFFCITRLRLDVKSLVLNTKTPNTEQNYPWRIFLRGETRPRATHVQKPLKSRMPGSDKPPTPPGFFDLSKVLQVPSCPSGVDRYLALIASD